MPRQAVRVSVEIIDGEGGDLLGKLYLLGIIFVSGDFLRRAGVIRSIREIIGNINAAG